VTYLVDGYNVIRRVSRFRRVEEERGLEAGREALLEAIRASPRLRSARVEVVFDGASREGPAGRSDSRLRVAFSPSADAAIVARLRSIGAPGEVSVVTADRDLGWECRRLAVRVMGPEEWVPWLGPGPGRRPAEEKPLAGAAEVAWGLAVFGDASIEVASRPAARAPRPASAPSPERARLKERRRARHLRRTR
jgi:hypothetical protein